jgi:isopropylmalate/homocitrate/citramalate synthase
MGFYEKNRWWVSHFNYSDSVVSRFSFSEKIEIFDTSLRDGEQQAGIVLRKSDKITLAKKLDEMGVHRIEAGMPLVSKEDEEAIRDIADLGLNAKIFCFVRNMPVDMKLAKDCGVYGVIAQLPGSEQLLKYGKKWTVEEAVKRAVEATSLAKELGLYISMFPADSSRASFSFLTDMIDAILDEGGHIDSLGLVDTFGVFSPEGAAYTVKKLKAHYNIPIELHFHDDFGLGVASTIAGLAAGAEVAHVTINGIGERAGGVPLEPLILSLECLYGYQTGMKLEKIKELSNLMCRLSGFPIQKNRPVVGDKIFGWETGLPSSSWLNCKDIDPLIMLPYHWSMTGQEEPKLYLGKKSGKDNLKKWIQDNNLNFPEDKEEMLLNKVKEIATELKRDITQKEFIQIVNNLQD